MCPSGVPCLSMDCCFTELVLLKIQLSVSSSSHWKLTCSHHDIYLKFFWVGIKQQSLTHPRETLIVKVILFISGWYRGHLAKDKSQKGIFPKSFVHLKEIGINKTGYESLQNQSLYLFFIWFLLIYCYVVWKVREVKTCFRIIHTCIVGDEKLKLLINFHIPIWRL